MSRVAIGSDHAGFDLKPHLAGVVRQTGHDVLDHGTDSTETVDYPPIGAASARTVRDGGAEVGVVIGGSGQGEQISANRCVGHHAHHLAQITDREAQF